jgi:cytochrome c'
MAMTRFAMLASLLVIVFIVPTRAADVAELLAPKLQGLLRQEMQAVLIATDEIVNASIEGDYAKLADRAQQIHDSFILEQAMTEEDRRTLLHVLPADFIELDEGFHALTAKLAAAARARDQQLVGRYVGDLVAACGNCHSRFATARFPAFETSH